MRRKKLKNRIKELSGEERIIAMAAVVSFIGCFLPWYGINSRVINQWWNGFSSIGSVGGYLIALFSIVIFAIAVLPVLKSGLDLERKLPMKKTSLLFFLSGQSFFVALIFIPVYAQYSLINATNSGTRFGLYLVLLSTLISSIVALSLHRRSERLSLQQDFATVPRKHREINHWQENDPDERPDQLEERDELEQESMFEKNSDELPQESTLITATEEEGEQREML